MMIYSMTATFGKLEHQTLTLQPGLNCITAPNEWGKSTWCAFLMAMFYGVDTRAKTTKNALADKEHYAPWSGAPMAGSIDLNWNGRDITIQRTTRGRVPMGEFAAFETKTGIPVPELTATNCGRLLLGEDREIYSRSGFIRLTDMPVTRDEHLRSRLNALVTTGDESGDDNRLNSGLKELKNRILNPRNGLIPQAKAEKDELKDAVAQLHSLQEKCTEVDESDNDQQEQIALLRNHLVNIAYQEALEDKRRVDVSQKKLTQIRQEIQQLEEETAQGPDRSTVAEKCVELRYFLQQWNDAQRIKFRMTDPPRMPDFEAAFQGKSPEEAVAMADADKKLFDASHGRLWAVFLILSVVCLGIIGYLVWLEDFLFASAVGIVCGLSLVIGIADRVVMTHNVARLQKKYRERPSELWHDHAVEYGEKLLSYRQATEAYNTAKAENESNLQRLTETMHELCGEEKAETVLDNWLELQKKWDRLEQQRRLEEEGKVHLEDLKAMARPIVVPEMEDILPYSREETNSYLTRAENIRQRLRMQKHTYTLRMEDIGTEEQLNRKIQKADQRIERLETAYAAAGLAQNALAQARQELQRRFAPAITRSAQQILARLTGGKYSRIVLAEDFSMRTGTESEDALLEAMWRSDGTVDQLYLALRLAVADALLPEAPLVLDDALVRFDDVRRRAAMEVLTELSQTRQVIVFSCQGQPNIET